MTQIPKSRESCWREWRATKFANELRIVCEYRKGSPVSVNTAMAAAFRAGEVAEFKRINTQQRRAKR